MAKMLVVGNPAPRTPKQIAATKKLVARNKRLAREAKGYKKPAKKKTTGRGTVINVKANPAKKKSTPRKGKMKPLQTVTKAIMPAVVSSGGALALDVGMGYANRFLPPMMQSGMYGGAVKMVGAVLLGLVAEKLKDKKFGQEVMVGGLTVNLHAQGQNAIKMFMPAIPLAGLGVYDSGLEIYDADSGLAYYSPAYIAKEGSESFIDDDGMGMYGMSAYDDNVAIRQMM